MFRDVAADHWARRAIERMVSAGIFAGSPDDLFHGERPMTRYEFAVAVARLLENSIEVG